MRILYLDSHVTDYGSAMLWDGLCRVLGNENVVVFPPKYTFYHRPDWSWVPRREEHGVKSEVELRQALDTFDLIVLASIREEAIFGLRMALATWRVPPPLVVLDENEDARLHSDLVKEFNPACYFKREMLLNRAYPDNCFPMPFSLPLESVGDAGERETDVWCVFADNYPERRWVDWLVGSLGMSFVRTYCHYHRGVDYDTYMAELRKSKMGVSMRGFGFDSTRHLEILASRTMLLSAETCQLNPYPLIDRVHCVYFHEGNLAWLIGYYLSSSSLRCEIANSGCEYYKKYHTTQARAEYFLERVKGFLLKELNKELNGVESTTQG